MCLIHRTIQNRRTLEYLWTKIRKNKRILVGVLLILAVFNSNISPLYFLYWGESENVSCHYSTVGNFLRPISDDFDPPPKSIYFLETSCRGSLNPRQACAVESAVKAHPEWKVYLLITSPVTEENLNQGVLRALNQFLNLSIRRLFLLDYVKGTPVERLVAEGALNRSRWPMIHTSDMLRFLTLFKWGGVYLDLDVVVRRPLDALAADWVARESTYSASIGALAFSRSPLGRTVADDVLKDFKQRFRGDIWGHNGPGVITRVLQRLCDTPNVTLMSAYTCHGFEVYGPDLFYPIPWLEANRYLEADDYPGDPYIHHVWNKYTQHLSIKKDSLYAKLAQKYCPKIYSMYKHHFGD